jgi:hypothetical protein
MHPQQQQLQQQQALPSPSEQQGQPAILSTARDRRRSGWTDRKQKSRSFDFSWRSGMWSPVDGTCTPLPVAAAASSEIRISESKRFSQPPVATVDGQGLLTVPSARPGGGCGGSTVSGSGAAASMTTSSQSATVLATSSASSTPRLGECRKSSPKLKLPPMFQMDSGSSYESYEATDSVLIQQQSFRVRN